MNLRNIFFFLFILYLVGVECYDAYARKSKCYEQCVRECDESKRGCKPIITLTTEQSHWNNPIVVIETYFPCENENIRTYEQFTGNGSNTIGDFIHYKGSYVDGRRHGYGSLKRFFPVEAYDNYEYVGEFSNNLFHGRGVLKYENGDEYCGDFQYGGFVKGKHYYRGLLKYEGSFEQTYRYLHIPTRPNYFRYGIYFYEKGAKYAGNYVDGFCTHNCIFTDPEGNERSRDWNFYFQE
jgi:hypothetical protein